MNNQHNTSYGDGSQQGNQFGSYHQGAPTYDADGMPIPPQGGYSPMRSPHSDQKTLLLILCILGFFGIAGIHRMVVGKVGTGILYLLTAGWFGIGTIVDIVKLAAGTFTDKQGRTVM